MSVVSVSSDAELSILMSSGQVVLDFWAPWCGACKAIVPHLEEVSRQTGVTVVKVNADDLPSVAATWKVSSLPTLVMTDGGQEIRRKVGSGGGIASLLKLVNG